MPLLTTDDEARHGEADAKDVPGVHRKEEERYYLYAEQWAYAQLLLSRMPTVDAMALTCGYDHRYDGGNVHLRELRLG